MESKMEPKIEMKAIVGAPTGRTQNFEHIEAQSITLRSPDGKRTISLQANNDIVGIWLGEGSTDGPLVAIYTEKGQTCVGIYGADEKKAINIGLSVEEGTGEPFIQLYSNKTDKVINLTMDDLQKLLPGK